MSGESGPDTFRRVCPLNTAVKTFRILSEYHDIDFGFGDPVSGTTDVIERISFERPAGADADVEIEMLAQSDDGAVINKALLFELRTEFPVGLILRLGSNRSKQADPIFFQKVQRSLGQRIPLSAPELPSDICGEIIGLEAGGIENSECFREKGFAYPVSGHDHNLVSIHGSEYIPEVAKMREILGGNVL